MDADWLQRIINYDRSLLLTLNGSESAWWDAVWWTITDTYTWVPLVLMLAYVMLKSGSTSLWLTFAVFLGLTIFLTDHVSAAVMKPFFHRLRPTHDPLIGHLVDTVRDYRGGMYGFVSSHAANTFGAFTFVALVFRSRLLTGSLFLWACLCCYSRIYLGVHFPGDILCGALFGAAVGALTYLLYRVVLGVLSPQRQYYSSAYTSSGFLHGDVSAIVLTLLLTYFYVGVRACFAFGV
ncbi:MAG: phosphatase PAP2 family protein [Bacteroidaceae bacterium]|nr:phosphatase PAP2 family protein [Bacteroidaceae bacterium]